MKTKPPIANPNFRKILDRLATHRDNRRVFDAFVRLAACALAAQTREPEYLEEAKHWTKDELLLFGEALGALVLEMESRPFEDLLGGYYMEYAISEKGRRQNGEFHTPKHICDVMAQITMGNTWPDEGPIKICEPACGAGAMILSIGEACPPEVRRRLRVTAIDINRTGCDMAFINTTLWGIPTRVIHGDAIAEKYWAAWSNIHYRIPWLPLLMGRSDEQGKPPTETEAQQINADLGQQGEFSL